jgi:hypothetical protein
MVFAQQDMLSAVKADAIEGTVREVVNRVLF